MTSRPDRCGTPPARHCAGCESRPQRNLPIWPALAGLANRRGAKVVNAGAALGKHLAALPQRQQALKANIAMRELADAYASGDGEIPKLFPGANE